MWWLVCTATWSMLDKRAHAELDPILHFLRHRWTIVKTVHHQSMLTLHSLVPSLAARSGVPQTSAMADVDNAVNRPAESDALRDALGAAFDEIAGVCGDPEVPKSSIPAVKHSRKFYFNPNQQVHANRVMELEQLYREESKVKNDFQDHMMSRVWDPDTTKPAKGLTGNSVQQYIQQGPEFTNVEYAVLARRQYDQLTQRVDRHTRNNGLVVGVSALPDTQIPLHAREILEDFFERFGAANETEVYMLAVAFALPEHTIESFCRCSVSQRFKLPNIILTLSSCS